MTKLTHLGKVNLMLDISELLQRIYTIVPQGSREEQYCDEARGKIRTLIDDEFGPPHIQVELVRHELA